MRAVGAALAVLALLGCAKPGVPAEQFVGTWQIELSEGTSFAAGPPTIVLRADATGTMADPPNPRPKSIIWLVKSDKLVLAPRDGTRRLECLYSFNGPDELVLSSGEVEVTYRRAE